MASLLNLLIFDAVYGSWKLSLLLFTLDSSLAVLVRPKNVFRMTPIPVTSNFLLSLINAFSQA